MEAGMFAEGLGACAISVAVLSCASSLGELSSTRQSESSISERDDIELSKSLRDVVVARWQGFRSLAKQLPDHNILAVELIRTSQDQTAAVITLGQNGDAVRYAVIGDAHGVPLSLALQHQAVSALQLPEENAVATDGGSIDPAFVSIGQPPPSEPTRPGIRAAASDLLRSAFGGESLATGRRQHPPLRLGATAALPANSAVPAADPAALLVEADAVMAARWRGFQALATQLPNREVLAIELFRTRQDQTVAVLTVVEHGAAVKYAIGDAHVGAASNQLSADSADELDPSFVATGRPPPEEPIPPGLATAGQELLQAAFQAD
jgi:hypothetical protein